MPVWVKAFLTVFVIVCLIIPLSAAIPFIYYNEHLIELSISYAVLFMLYTAFVLFQHKFVETSFYQNLSTKKSIQFFCSTFIFPVMVGYTLSLLTPITADFFASEFQIHEYKAVKAESYAKSFRHLSKVYVVDIYNNSANFVIKNEILNQLNLHEGDKLVVTGRNCIAGFVIDKINGVERK